MPGSQEEESQREKILEKLLFKSPQTNGELAKSLGHVNDKGIARHNMVSAPLEYLHRIGFIRRKKVDVPGARGPTPTFNWIIDDLPVLERILNKYPNLLSAMQKNDKITSMLIDKHINEVCTDEWLSDTQILDFKNRLKISATLFRLWLLKEPKELQKIINTLFSITKRGQEFEQYNRDFMKGVWETEKQIKGSLEKKYQFQERSLQAFGFAGYQPSFNDLIDVVFQACIYSDILNEQECSAGIDYTKKMLSEKVLIEF